MAHCILTSSTTITSTETLTSLSFDQAVESGGTFFDPLEPTRITIPSGFSDDFVEINFCAGALIDLSEFDFIFAIYKNGNEIYRFIRDDQDTGSLGGAIGPIAVAPGDYFELRHETYQNRTVDYVSGQLAFSLNTLNKFGAASLALPTPNRAMVATGNGEVITDWVSEFDNLSAYNGTGKVICPSGTEAIKVSAFLKATDFFAMVRCELRVNGTMVREMSFVDHAYDFGNLIAPFGVIEAVEGDEIELYVYSIDGGEDWAGNHSRFSVEFIGGPSVDPIALLPDDELINGGAEYGTAFGWTATNVWVDTAMRVFPFASPQSGTYLFTCDTSSSASLAQTIQVPDDNLGINFELQFSYYIRGLSGDSVRLDVELYDATDTLIATRTGITRTPGNAWSKIDETVTGDENCTYYIVKFIFTRGDGVEINVGLDNISLLFARLGPEIALDWQTTYAVLGYPEDQLSLRQQITYVIVEETL